jgi:hypothetical protein
MTVTSIKSSHHRHGACQAQKGEGLWIKQYHTSSATGIVLEKTIDSEVI